MRVAERASSRWVPSGPDGVPHRPMRTVAMRGDRSTGPIDPRRRRGDRLLGDSSCCVVPRVGIEPTLPFRKQILSLSRLPISPPRPRLTTGDIVSQGRGRSGRVVVLGAACGSDFRTLQCPVGVARLVRCWSTTSWRSGPCWSPRSSAGSFRARATRCRSRSSCRRASHRDGPGPDGAAAPELPRARCRTLLNPTLGNLGTAYVEGDIDLEGPIDDILDVGVRLSASTGGDDFDKPEAGLLTRVLSHSRARDKERIEYHYDVSNDFYRLFLDENLVYSCAYFKRDRRHARAGAAQQARPHPAQGPPRTRRSAARRRLRLGRDDHPRGAAGRARGRRDAVAQPVRRTRSARIAELGLAVALRGAAAGLSRHPRSRRLRPDRQRRHVRARRA